MEYLCANMSVIDSVESNVVILASCIPTLHPLLEIILGRRTLRSWSASRDRYKNSSSHTMPNVSVDRSKRTNAARKQDLTITNVESQESQESILRADDQHIDGHPLSEIRRTDNVTVEYESRSGAAMDHERAFW